jgi:integrase
MSVFIHKTTKDGTYSYDFQFRGQRFTGGTGCTTRREAEAAERAEKDNQRRLAALNEGATGKHLNLEQAAGRWMAEVGNKRKDRQRCLDNIDWLLTHFGAGIRLTAIDDDAVAKMVTKRAGEHDQRIKHGTPRLVTATTVNRTAIEPLRHIIGRARHVWKVPTARIDFSNHVLKEPQERVREATVEEEAAIMDRLDRGYQDAAQFAFGHGLRRAEVVNLKWTDVDWFNRKISVFGKGDKRADVPLSQAGYDLLWSLRHHHKTAVFTYVSAYTRRGKNGVHYIKGEHYPITYEGFGSAFKRGVGHAGVKDFRIHDMRHTAASRVARSSNLKVTQTLLRHSDIRTTMRYVHCDVEDVRAALDAASPVKSPVRDDAAGTK